MIHEQTLITSITLQLIMRDYTKSPRVWAIECFCGSVKNDNNSIKKYLVIWETHLYNTKLFALFALMFWRKKGK